MNIGLLIVLGIAISMDALTISIIVSLTTKKLTLKEWEMPIIFGISHGIMIILGYIVSSTFANIIYSIDHWIAFGILVILGLKMIQESNKKTKTIDWDKWKNIILISIATSIDAFALGITINILQQELITSSIILGSIVIILSYFGLFFGKKLQYLKPKYNYRIGGIMLIIIGTKILIEHLL